jgi:hypothetical protein
MIKLRAHHLLCMLTFRGRGYTPTFSANFAALIARMKSGETIEIVEGADDICAPLQGTNQWHCDEEGPQSRDELALLELNQKLFPDAEIGSKFELNAEIFAAAYEHFQINGTGNACHGCQWNSLCNDILKSEA